MTLKLFISHSSHTDAARRLRDTVATHLAAQPGIEVLWDANIRPGDRWRSVLDEWLADCNGGVVLFTQDALASKWVLKEAQILTWRRAVADHFPLIPVLLQPVTRSQTGLADWQPVALDEIQFAKGPDPETMDATARNKLADEIRVLLDEQAGDIDFDNVDDPLSDWIAQLADELVKAEEGNLESAARALGIDERPPDTARKRGWAQMIARRLLHFGCEPTVVADPQSETFLRLAEILKRATHTLSDEKRKKVARQYFPMWVNPDAVRDVHPLAASGQAIAINARSLDSGREYADRATFGLTSSRDCFIAVPEIHDGDPDMIFERYQAELIEHFYLDDDVPTNWDDQEQFTAWVDALTRTRANKGTDIFVVLHKDACNATVLRRLRERFPPFTFMLLVGPKATDASHLESATVKVLQPLVPPEHERDVRQKFCEFA